jgi:hypothetical protein
MKESAHQKKHSTHISWEDIIAEDKQIADWRDSAFQAAVEKLQREHGNADVVMRTGEAFGRGLFAQLVKEKTSDWTIQDWFAEIEKDVFKPIGTEFTFTKISHDVATTFIQRDPRTHLSKDSSIISLFNFGVMRGLFLSAFPKGELLMNETEAIHRPEFVLKTHASAKDRFEAERIIHGFNILKKEDGV